jgi:hypothetical protein
LQQAWAVHPADSGTKTFVKSQVLCGTKPKLACAG